MNHTTKQIIKNFEKLNTDLTTKLRGMTYCFIIFDEMVNINQRKRIQCPAYMKQFSINKK